MYYPHTLHVLTTNTGVKDSAGNFSADPGEWTLVGECREEANSKGSKVMLPDGSLVQYSSMIFLPAGSYSLQFGQSIKVMDGSVQRFYGSIARLSNDRKNSRLWA